MSQARLRAGVSANGVLLTPLALVKDVSAVQVRFSNGEVFDDVQMLGLDERRGIAAIKVSGTLKLRPIVLSDVPMAGDAVTVVTHPGGAAWSAASGSYGSVRMADDIPGAGSGFKVVQFNASGVRGANGGAIVSTPRRGF